MDAAAEVHHEAPDRHHGAFWNESELFFIRAVLENAFEMGHDHPKLRERIVYAIAGTTGFVIPDETLHELRQATRRKARQIREQARALNEGLTTVEEFQLADTEEASSKSENSDLQVVEQASSAPRSRWG